MAIVLLLAACGGAAGGDGDAEGAAELEGELRYTRSGGFAGAHDELVIQPDGAARLSVRGANEEEFNLSEDELESLATALGDAGLEDIPSDSTSDPAAPDAFTYVIGYGDEEVRTDDASVPSELTKLLTALDRIVSEHRPG